MKNESREALEKQLFYFQSLEDLEKSFEQSLKIINGNNKVIEIFSNNLEAIREKVLAKEKLFYDHMKELKSCKEEGKRLEADSIVLNETLKGAQYFNRKVVESLGKSF